MGLRIRHGLGRRIRVDRPASRRRVSVGVFTTGHAPANAFDERARITKPGGSIVFSLRTQLYERDGFREYFSGLEAAGVWRLAERSEPFHPLPRREPEVIHRIWVY